MRIDISVEIPFSRRAVFEAYRDKLPELVPYLENVRAIIVTSRSEEGHLVKLVNRWKGGGEIPAVVRKFLSEDLLEWDDHATWDSQAFRCNWQTVVPAFRESVDAKGFNTYVEKGPSLMQLTISGELKVDAAKIRGVPRILAGTVSPAVEAFLVGRIKPNLIAVAKGVEKYLRSKA